MCTWITEKVPMTGRARGVPEWISVTQANVSYDHPSCAPFDHAVLIDFVNPEDGVGARIGIELSATSARALVSALNQALATPEAVRDLHAQSTRAAAPVGSRG
jgi:hypothetical protein